MSRDFKATFTETENLSASMKDSDSLGARFGSVQFVHTDDYEDLVNKPQIENVTLVGNKTMKQLGVDTLSVQEIEQILYLD